MAVFPETQWVTARPESEGLDGGALERAMDVVRRISGEGGADEALVVRRGRVVWQGPRADVRHSVWSCTKSFLSTVLGLLVDDGACSLETRAADVYRPLERLYPAVTLGHLVTFGAGYRPRAASSEEPPFEPAEPLFEPGTRFHYWWDSYLLALVLTMVAGESVAEVFRRRVARPIGLADDEWAWGGWGPLDEVTGLRGVPVCMGSGLWGRGVTISARGIARVGWLYACGGEWAGRRIVSREWVSEATRAQVPADRPPHDPSAWYGHLPGRYGYFWWTNGADARGERLWPNATPRTCAMQGHLNNICFVIPEWEMVMVRLGEDAVIDDRRYDGFFAAMRAAFTDGTSREEGAT